MIKERQSSSKTNEVNISKELPNRHKEISGTVSNILKSNNSRISSEEIMDNSLNTNTYLYNNNEPKKENNLKNTNRQRPSSAPRSRRNFDNEENPSFIDHRANHSFLQSAYASKIRADKVNLEARQVSLQECTFNPKIKELPSYYGGKPNIEGLFIIAIHYYNDIIYYYYYKFIIIIITYYYYYY